MVRNAKKISGSFIDELKGLGGVVGDIIQNKLYRYAAPLVLVFIRYFRILPKVSGGYVNTTWPLSVSFIKTWSDIIHVFRLNFM